MNHGDAIDFETRVAQVEAAAAAVAKFDNPELQVAAFHYLLGDAAARVGASEAPVRTPDALVREPSTPPTDGDKSDGGTGTDEKRKRPASKASPSKKQTLTVDKSLNFYSSGGELGKTLKDFVEAHPAANVVQKSVAVVYWLSKELALQEINVDHVYSAFKTLEWPIPSNLLNTLQQAGSKNFLDTKKSTDIKMTTHGENLVEFQLVPKAADA